MTHASMRRETIKLEQYCNCNNLAKPHHIPKTVNCNRCRIGLERRPRYPANPTGLNSLSWPPIRSLMNGHALAQIVHVTDHLRRILV